MQQNSLATHYPRWENFSLDQIAAQLPPIARRKLRALRSLAAESGMLQKASHDRRVELDNMARDLEYKIQVAEVRNDEAHRIVSLREELQGVLDDLRQLDAEKSRRSAIEANILQVLARLDQFLPMLDGVALQAVTTNAQPLDGESLADGITRIRREISRAVGEISRVKELPLPADELKARIRAEVEALAAQGAPKIDLSSGKLALHFCDDPLFGAPGQAKSAPPLSATRTLAFMFPDLLVECLTSAVDGVEGISTADKAQRLTELEAHLLALERAEECFVEAALTQGIEAHRRPNASGFALLCIEPVEIVAAEIEEVSRQEIEEVD
jgi:hypothetical protein